MRAGLEHPSRWITFHGAVVIPFGSRVEGAARTGARVMLGPVEEGRLRLDAATWGTMGVGLGCAVAAATARPGRLVVAVEGDSAFGFSGMECETIARRAPGGAARRCPACLRLAVTCSRHCTGRAVLRE